MHNKYRAVIISFSLLVLFSCQQASVVSKREIHPISPDFDSLVVIPPSWAFGVLYGGYTNQAQTIQRIKEIQDHDYPIDAYWIDSWFWSFEDQGRGPKKYLDFVGDTVAFPDRKSMWDFMQTEGIKGGFWIWDCILETGNELAFNEFDSLGFFSDKYINKNSWHNASTSTAMFQETNDHPGTLTGNIDFENENAVAHFKSRVKPFFDEGADFIKLDRTSKIPVLKAMFEMTQDLGKETKGRGFILSHSDQTEDPTYKLYPTKWTDDTRSDWNISNPTKEFPSWIPKVAFKENIEMFTDPNRLTSQIPFLTNDTGGFDKGLTDELDEELYIRWVQFSAFNPIMEVFSQPENPTSNLAYKYSNTADQIFKEMTHLRMRLFPYIYTYALKTRFHGDRLMKPIENQLYDFYFGDSFLVFPVYEKGATKRVVKLPSGVWIDYHTSKKYAGDTLLEVDAPLNKIPIFIKEGTIIPQRAYAASIEKGNNDFLQIHVYGGRDSEFKLFEDDGSSNDYLDDIYATTTFEWKESGSETVFIVNPVVGGFEGMKDERSYELVLHTSKIYESATLDNETIEVNIKEGKQYLRFEAQKNQKTIIKFKTN